MEAIPRNDGEQYRFDAFCKAVLRNEARNYHRNKKRLLDREKSFSVLSMEELGQLTSVDHYPSEEFIFSSYGCDLHLDNELVANAFAALPKQEQSILILFCVLELGDGKIGDLMGMSRSAVQRHRTKTLNELQKKLKAHLPEGGYNLHKFMPVQRHRIEVKWYGAQVSIVRKHWVRMGLILQKIFVFKTVHITMCLLFVHKFDDFLHLLHIVHHQDDRIVQ